MSADLLGAAWGVLLLLVAQSEAVAEGFAGLGGEAHGFAMVTPGKPLEFPKDFGAHQGFRTEWWYVTANLEDASGTKYGVQWTLFRHATEPGRERDGWASQNVWMGHAAVTSAKEHLFSETFARGGVGQAGVAVEPFRAWIDNWSLESSDKSPAAGLSRLVATAKNPNFGYELRLAADKPLVRHGEQGFSRKSDAGQASYYFSQPFFTAEGLLAIGGREVKVSGRAWMDREWSSQPLAADQKGWDWFSLHLGNGEQLMLYRFRSEARNFLAGTWIASDGAAQALESGDIDLAPVSYSILAGRSVPTAWKIKVKSRAFDIETSPLNPQSWMGTSFAYWEGPIGFAGSHQGDGYLEMTGY